jgi:hypothetical protein
MNAEALACNALACLLGKHFSPMRLYGRERATLFRSLLYARILLAVGQTQLQRAFFLP